jgi:hypothetical protein
VTLRAEEIIGSNGSLGDRSLVAESFATISAERTLWLWDGRIPLGTATLLVGREKLGKSTLTIELAARLSRGELAGDLEGSPSDTLIVSYEDSASRTIKPRLLAANADLEHVHRALAKRGGMRDLVTLPDDIERIGILARELGVRLVVVDPLSASLSGDVNSNRDQDIRRALAPFMQLAEEEDLAVLAITHWNKANGGDSLSRVLGSRGLTAAVRSILAFGRTAGADDGPERVLVHAACNLGPEAPALSCRIDGSRVVADDGETIFTSRLVLGGECEARAEDLLATHSPDERSEHAGVADWLADELADGSWHETQQVLGRGKVAGYSRSAIYKGMKELGVESERRGYPARASWRISCPDPVVQVSEDGAGTTGQIPSDREDSGIPEAQLSTSLKTRTTGGPGAATAAPRCCCADGGEPGGDGRCGRCYGWVAEQ